VRSVTSVVVTVVAVALALCALAWWGQERLIFFPQPIASTSHLPPRAIPLEIFADDGTRLRGFMRPGHQARAPVVICFGGNAEEASWMLAEPRWPSDVAIAAINYRGYGASEGKPSESALSSDALKIFDAMAARDDVDRERIVVFGRSLGTAVAVYVAAQRPVAAVVLASPFDSLAAVGRVHYPFLPVSLLLRHRFDAAALATRAQMPLLAVVGDGDAIVPPARSRALFEAWAGPKTWRVVGGAGHDDLGAHPAFWDAVTAFLRAQMR
jgi:pimeloyl-ACP methyl ester carboxylesterase